MENQTKEVHIIREFNAPRKAVWDAWTDPEKHMRWWGPQYFTSPACKMDFREGGKYHFCMRSPDGKDFWSMGEYTEINPIDRIVFTDSFADAEGNPVSASYYGMDENTPMTTEVTVTFEEIAADKTRMTLRHAGLPETVQAEAGWNQSFDKLAKVVENV